MYTHQNKKYLLIPSMPTPNGRIHLGHIGGPFLKMDLINRFCNQTRITSKMYGGSDVNDSFIMLEAENTKRDPEEVCHENHRGIISDFKRMNIQFDCYINPLSDDVSEDYKNCIKSVNLKSLNKIGVETTELYPFDKEIGFLPASYISGLCPSCLNTMTGFLCENCSLSSKPSSIKEKKYLRDFEIENKEVVSYFSKVSKVKIRHWWKSLSLPLDIKEKILSCLEKTEAIRGTSPIKWGVKIDTFGSRAYNYNIYPYSLFLSQLCQKNNNWKVNPFLSHSDVHTAFSYGIDNIATGLINAPNMAFSIENHKPYDTNLINYFMTLNGHKFSTSRNHAIWISKLPKNISIDILRLFLLKINVDNFSCDFNVDDFVCFYNKISSTINNASQAIKNAKEYESINPKDKNKLIELIEYRNQYCFPENYSANSYFNLIEKWMNSDIEQNRFWLIGFAYLCYPIMPKISMDICAKSNDLLSLNESIDSVLNMYGKNIKKITVLQISDIIIG